LQALELAVIPLDAARRTTLRLATRSPQLTRILARRDTRIACMAAAQVTLLFALSAAAPVAMYFLGPVVFGVAHLAADVRYLVLRRAPPRSLLLASAVLAIAITAARVGASAHALSVRADDMLGVVFGMAWIGVALAVGLRHRVRLAAAIAPFFLGAAGLLVARAHLVNIALVHVHNLVALAVWLVLFRRRRGWAVLPLGLVVAFAAVLLSGACSSWSIAHGGFVAFGMRAAQLGAWLGPGLPVDAAVPLAATFVFLQGVHYAAWTAWIPQDALRSEGTPTFRMTVRNLVKDFGPAALGVIVLLALGFVGLAVWNVRASVMGYLTLAKWHAWFELAFLAYFGVRGDRPRALP
jgi:hypothetical protein